MRTHDEESSLHIAARGNGDMSSSGYRKLCAQINGIADARRVQAQ